ncbi:LamG-like jellyroll fold domain-containing protein [Poriferisphaera sp. WC338]|uniref:LamG-like jellyroll fold domain-containing protein n=1 Tax=Poriferisphaera sp. WC338 TaxID=3425129 RepID=UPI003D812F1F
MFRLWKKWTAGLCAVSCVAAMGVHANAALVAQWNFDDGTYEDQAGSLDGGAIGSTSIVAAGSNQLGNDMGKAVQTGSSAGSDYLNVGDLNTLGVNGSFTVTMWVKHNALPTDGTVSPEFWDSWNSGTGPSGGGFISTIRRGNNGGNAGLIFTNIEDTNDSSGDLLKPSPRIDDGLWHFYAIRYISSANTAKIYLDGVESGDSEVGAYNLSRASGGKSLRLGDGFDGMIDDIRIYDAALSVTLDGSKTLTDGDLYDVWHAQVPEPGVMGLVGLAGLMAMLRRGMK